MSSKVVVAIYVAAVMAGVGTGFLYRPPLQKTELDKKLELAVADADVAGVQRMLASHPRLDAVFSDSSVSILGKAVGWCAEGRRTWEQSKTPNVDEANPRVQIVKLLLEAGADPNVARGYITGALASGDTGLMELLISHGARVRYTSEVEYTHYYLGLGRPNVQGFEKCLEMAINVGYELNHRDRSGRTKLHAIVQSGTIEFEPCTTMAAIMVKHGLDVNAKDCLGMTPYDYAPTEAAQQVLASMGARPSQ